MTAGTLTLVSKGTHQKASSKQTLASAAKVLQRAVRGKAKKKVSVAKLTNQVKQLKVETNGALQMMRQRIRWEPQFPGPPVVHRNYISNLRPLAFLHQAISHGALVHSNSVVNQTPPLFSSVTPIIGGRWIEQEFPLTLNYNCDPATYKKFDQLQYWGQAGGVQNKYYHTSTLYQLQINAVAATGYIDIFLLHPKKSFIRSSAKDVSLPAGLPGFTNLSLGSNNQYTVNNQYYTCKRIKRKYFNTVRATVVPPLTVSRERELQTNPNIDIKFRIRNDKSRRLILAPEDKDTGILDSTDIPYHKQDWILISTTVEDKDVGENNHIKVENIFRTPIWRDYYGAST